MLKFGTDVTHIMGPKCKRTTTSIQGNEETLIICTSTYYPDCSIWQLLNPTSFPKLVTETERSEYWIAQPFLYIHKCEKRFGTSIVW